VLQLLADDSAMTSSDDVQITVNADVVPITVESRVSASSDDAEESASGSVSLSSSDLELVFDGSNQTVGMRFNNIAVPQGASIVNAYVQFKVDETQSENTSLTIQGQAADNATTFTSGSQNVSSRARTVSSVNWSPIAWSTIGEAGVNQRTPNLAAVIQEIVNRPAWASGNSLVLIITGSGHRTAESYDGDLLGAPLLHVEFTTSPLSAGALVSAESDTVTSGSASGPNTAAVDLIFADGVDLNSP
jgi:hypothetical protein